MQRIQDMFINMEEVAEDAYKNTELLLSQYTKVMFRIEKNLVDIDYEMYAEEGKHLKEMLYALVDFDATAEKRRIQEKLLNNDMNLCLLEIMRDSMIALRDYPKNGQLYYRLLKYRYFEAGNTNEDVMLMLDDMPSTTYYRNRKKAIRLYATMLWAFTRPEKIQNKMEEINWKKSGSKVAVISDRPTRSSKMRISILPTIIAYVTSPSTFVKNIPKRCIMPCTPLESFPLNAISDLSII